jgi:hypothetical protein
VKEASHAHRSLCTVNRRRLDACGRGIGAGPARDRGAGRKRGRHASCRGPQVYDCKAGSDGKLAWAFREPVATLLLDGKTVGRHYAGPNWEHVDGSAVVGKAVANAAGKTPSDIPWLKLEVTAHRGSGALSGVTTVQRINTRGGAHAGACDQAGALHSAPYAADYVFLKKGS